MVFVILVWTPSMPARPGRAPLAAADRLEAIPTGSRPSPRGRRTTSSSGGPPSPTTSTSWAATSGSGRPSFNFTARSTTWPSPDSRSGCASAPWPRPACGARRSTEPPFDTFRSQDEGLIGQYEADPSLTFANTLAQDKSPGLYGGADFWASIMMQLAARHGDQEFVERFWHLVGSLPTANSTIDAVTNWVQAASSAACTDLSAVFYSRWGFPRPDGTTAPRPPSGNVPEPAGNC